MQGAVDILENDIKQKYPEILNILLCDQTTQKNIFWATENYKYLGESYSFDSPLLPDLITGANGNVIMPRVYKDKVLQLSRSREMAEVFTPSWICNAQNNLVDNSWFGKEYIFNTEIILENGTKTWETTKNKIIFPKGKTWKDYIIDTRLEISCGEAPYLVSRYDTTTGEYISIENRIGLLDRKLRVINENLTSNDDWINAVQIAYKNIYGFEWQGDSLLLARESLLFTFIENHIFKFGTEPKLEFIQNIAHIISWNLWQMDGLKGIIPNTCKENNQISTDLFGVSEKIATKCEGCKSNSILKHNGIYCYIMDWENNKPIRFVDLIEK